MTLITLVLVVPTAYMILDDIGRTMRRIFVGREPATGPAPSVIEKQNAVRAGIDDALSKEIVVRRELHGHGTGYPWRLLRARREEARGQEWPVH